MTSFQKFEEMKVWQESRNLIRAIRAICKNTFVAKDFSFCDQITRSARSVSANIAEGSDALSSKEFIMFLGYAKRSVAEVRSHLYDALDEKYISKEQFLTLTTPCSKIGSMIAKLIHYLQNPVTRNS